MCCVTEGMQGLSQTKTINQFLTKTFLIVNSGQMGALENSTVHLRKTE